MSAFRADYPHFDAYEAGVLQEESTLEQLLTMDGELANYIYLSKYIGSLYSLDLYFSRSCELILAQNNLISLYDTRTERDGVRIYSFR